MSQIAPESANLISAQKQLRIGDTAPDFTGKSQLGPFRFYDFLGDSWGLLFSHPRDFTPVCTTELGRMAQLAEAGEWTKRNVKTVALSVDSSDHHLDWIKDINAIQGVEVKYPIVADSDRHISVLYGMLDQTLINDDKLPATVRSVYFIDPKRTIRAIITYPASTGRNFNEILRVIDSLQMTTTHSCATPVDWQKGKDVMVLPHIPQEETPKLFPLGVKVVTKWYRTTPDPVNHEPVSTS